MMFLLLAAGYAAFIALVLRRDQHFMGAWRQMVKNLTREDKKIKPFEIYPFTFDSKGHLQPSKKERRRTRRLAFLAFLVGPFLLLTTVQPMVQSAHSPLGFLMAPVLPLGFALLCLFFSNTKRMPEWEGPLRHELVFKDGKWLPLERGMPDTPHIVFRDEPVPQTPAETVYVRVFNPSTGGYEFQPVFRNGDPNIKPEMPKPAPDTFGSSEMLGNEELRRMGAGHREGKERS